MGILYIQVPDHNQNPVVLCLAYHPLAKAVMAKPIMAGQLKAKAEEEDEI